MNWIPSNQSLESSQSPSQQKISLFMPSLEGGGAERVMVHLANGFCERGFQVDLVLVSAEGPYRSLLGNRLRVVDLKCSRTLFSLPRLVRYLRAEKPNVVLSTLEHSNTIAVLACILTRNSQKIVVRVPNNPNAPIKSIRSQIVRILARYTYFHANKIIAVSEELANDLICMYKLPQGKVQTIYNPAITLELLSKAKEPLKHPWVGPNQLPLILGVGRLSKQKDFSTLIRAFSHLCLKCPARLIIVGEGEERPKLESLIRELCLEDRVSLPGFVDNPFQYIKHASTVVLSSRWEGMPNVLLQALAIGIPVVATDCTYGPREILENGKWGKLVPVGDAEALSQAILKSLNEEIRCPPIELLEKRFGLESIVEQYLSVLV